MNKHYIATEISDKITYYAADNRRIVTNRERAYNFPCYTTARDFLYAGDKVIYNNFHIKYETETFTPFIEGDKCNSVFNTMAELLHGAGFGNYPELDWVIAK